MARVSNRAVVAPAAVWACGRAEMERRAGPRAADSTPEEISAVGGRADARASCDTRSRATSVMGPWTIGGGPFGRRGPLGAPGGRPPGGRPFSRRTRSRPPVVTPSFTPAGFHFPRLLNPPRLRYSFCTSPHVRSRLHAGGCAPRTDVSSAVSSVM